MSVHYVNRKQIFFVLNQQEGWNLFDTKGSRGGDIQIQWIDDGIDKGKDDDLAMEFVIAKALDGSERHQWALGQVKKYNDKEWERICGIAYARFEIGESEIPTRDLGFNFF